MKVKYNDVPKDYRRNYKREAVEALQKIAICFIVTIFFLIMFWIA